MKNIGDKMKGYEVWGYDYLTTYTTKKKAERLVYEHPTLELKIKEVPLSFRTWLMLKLVWH